MTVTLATFSVTVDADCPVAELWDRMRRPDVLSGWMETVDGIEDRRFDADIRDGGHVTYDFRIASGMAIRTKSRLLRLSTPSRMASVAVETSYGGKLGISSLVRVAIVPRGDSGSRLVHTETAHFLTDDATPAQHRDFTRWWYCTVLREVAAAYPGAGTAGT